jgi:hypothetical protein
MREKASIRMHPHSFKTKDNVVQAAEKAGVTPTL